MEKRSEGRHRDMGFEQGTDEQQSLWTVRLEKSEDDRHIDLFLKQIHMLR